MKITRFLFCAAFCVWAAGCEKQTTPFTADAVTPPQGTVDVYVRDGNNPAPNVTIKGIDPSGNIFTTSSDSIGMAIFNPIPFNPGNWTFQMPNQNNRCFGSDSQSVTLTTGANSKSVTFQYGILVSLTTGFPSSAGFPPPLFSGSINFSTQNDCGITWICHISISGSANFLWTIGNSGGLNPGQTYTFNLASGQSVPWTIGTFSSGSINNNITLTSPFGSTSSGSGGINVHF